MKYNTFDYLRDNYGWFELISSIFSRMRKYFVKTVKSVVDSDVDNYIFRIVENLPYGILIIFLGFFLVIGIIRATEKDNGLKVYNITTSSMDPAIKPGSLVFSYPRNKYKEGNIINYKEKNPKTKTYSGRVLTHRITDVSEKDRHFVYTAKGDNNEHPDPGEIITADITGAVFLIIPMLGYIDFIVRTVPGFIIFIVIPALILIREARSYIKDNI